MVENLNGIIARGDEADHYGAYFKGWINHTELTDSVKRNSNGVSDKASSASGSSEKPVVETEQPVVETEQNGKVLAAPKVPVSLTYVNGNGKTALGDMPDLFGAYLRNWIDADQLDTALNAVSQAQ